MPNPAYDITSVHRLLELHDDGDTLAKLNADFSKLVADTADVAGHQGKAIGEITIKMRIGVDSKKAAVRIEHTVKPPKQPAAETALFVADDGKALTTQNPRQREMFDGAQIGPRGKNAAVVD